jgi:multidrug resistance efflux pump
VDAQTAAADSKQKLDQQDTRATQNTIDDAAARVQDAKTKLKDAQDEFDKYKSLDKNNATRQSTEATLESDRNTYDTAVVDYTKAMNDLEILRANDAKAQAAEKEAQRKYDASKDGPDPDALALAKSRLSDAQAQLDAAKAAVDNLELVAPYAGTVVQLEVSAGEYATINQPVLQIADLSDLYVETSDLTELKVVNIVPDMKVTITPDALPDLHLTGHVVLIRDNFIEKSGDIDYIVRIHLDKTDPRLKWGMTVSADFQP